jgi:hypothetical protein
MRNLICELKLPFVILAVMMLVWSAGQRAANPPADYSPPLDRAAWHRVAGLHDKESHRDVPVVTLDPEH